VGLHILERRGAELRSLCRSERDLRPTSESTALEGREGFVEYVAAGKLKGKKALITGGEYVLRIHRGFKDEVVLMSVKLRDWQGSSYSLCS